MSNGDVSVFGGYYHGVRDRFARLCWSCITISSVQIQMIGIINTVPYEPWCAD